MLTFRTRGSWRGRGWRSWLDTGGDAGELGVGVECAAAHDLLSIVKRSGPGQ